MGADGRAETGVEVEVGVIAGKGERKEDWGGRRGDGGGGD